MTHEKHGLVIFTLDDQLSRQIVEKHSKTHFVHIVSNYDWKKTVSLLTEKDAIKYIDWFISIDDITSIENSNAEMIAKCMLRAKCSPIDTINMN